MTLLSLLNAFALVAYVYLAALVLARNPRSRLNWSCALFLLAMAFWGLEEVFHGSPASTIGTVELFSNVGTVGRASFASLFLWFTLVLTRRERTLRAWWVYLLLLGIPIVLAVGLWTGRFNVETTRHQFGWVVVWPWSVWSVAFYTYYVSFMSAAFLLLWRFRRRALHVYERRQSTLILITAAASLLLGSVTDVFLPNLASIEFPEMAGFSGLFWAVGLYISLTRYGLMRVTPQSAAEDILTTMLDALLLTSPDGEVITANQAALELFGYRALDLEGRPARMLFESSERYDDALGNAVATGRLAPVQLVARTADGRSMPVSATARVMRGPDGSATGVVWVVRDASERVKAGQALAESEERYRSFVQDFQGIAFRSGLDFRTEFLHGAVREITGYGQEEFSSGAVRWRQLIHPDDVECLRTGTEKLRTIPNCSTTRDYRIVRKDGEVCWVREIIHNVCDAAGRPARLDATIYEVTEHKRVLEELSELSQFREDVIDSASVWMAVVTTEMKVVIWNRAAELISGYPREKVVGNSQVWQWLYSDAGYRRALRDRGEATIGQGRTMHDLETPITCADGEVKVLSLTVRPLVRPDGSIESFLFLGQDITERRCVEQALRESEEKYRNLVERASDGIAILQDGVIKYANPRLVRMSGHSTDEVLGHPFTDHVAAEERSRLVALYQGRMAGEHLPATYETTLVMRNGQRLTVELSAGLVTYEGSTADLVIIRDVTERRRAVEQQLRRLQDTAFLSRSAMELTELPATDDIYRFVGTRLKELTGAVLVFVNSHEPDRMTITVRCVLGLEPHAAEAVRMLGRSPEGLVLPLPHEARENLIRARLTAVPGGLHALALGAIPEPVCKAIEKLYGLGTAYSIGLAWQGRLYGNASVVMPAGVEIEDPEVVEVLIRQTAIALQRRKAETALQNSEASFRALAENASDGIMILAADRTIVYANPQACATFGTSLRETVGADFRRLVRQSDIPALEDRLAKRLKGEPLPAHIQLTVDRKRGGTTRIEVTGARTLWLGRPAVLVIMRDIKARDQAPGKNEP